MNREELEAALDGIMESLAAIEHERWCHWQRYMHNEGTLQSDGSLLLPSESIQHWERLLATPYAELSEEEKESDRDQVRRYLKVVVDGVLRAR